MFLWVLGSMRISANVTGEEKGSRWEQEFAISTCKPQTTGNNPGLMMPGAPKLKTTYYQERAPAIAMDRAEIVSLTETGKTTAGTFSARIKVKEGSAIDPLAMGYKCRAPGHRARRQRGIAAGQVRISQGVIRHASLL